MLALRYIEVMYFAIVLIIVKSILPTIPDTVYFSATKPDFYTPEECNVYLEEQSQALATWFKEYKVNGTIAGECRKIIGIHKA